MPEIRECGYCAGRMGFFDGPVRMASGELWHRECAMEYNLPRRLHCSHPGQPGQDHLGLPCAWPKCPEGHEGPVFWIPLPDKTRALFDPAPIPTARTPDAEYKRITAYVHPIAQQRYDMPPLLYRWVRQET